MVGGQVPLGDGNALTLEPRGQLLRQVAPVKAVRVGGDTLQGLPQLRLAERIARGPGLLAEDGARFGVVAQVRVVQQVRFLLGQPEAFAGHADRWAHHREEPEPAVCLLGVHQPRYRARHSDRARPNGAVAGDDVALAVQVHVGRSGGGCGLAKVDKGVARCGSCVLPVRARQVDEHKTAAAQVAGERVHDRKHERGGHRGIDRVAAFFQRVEAGIGGQVLHAHHHGMEARLGLLGPVAGDGTAGARRGLGAHLASDGKE